MKILPIGKVIIISVLIFTFCLTPSIAGRSLFQKIVDTAIDIIIGGVKFGLEETGTRLLGPTAWKGFKVVLIPIIRTLQRIFPGLSFDSPGDEVAVESANEAVRYLRQDKDLQRTLVENFTKLEKGQQEILSGINRLEGEVGTIKEIVIEIQKEIKEAQGHMLSSKLPTWVDVSGLIDHYFLMTEAMARREGIKYDPRVVRPVAYLMGMIDFDQIVCEDGQSHKIYKCKIGNKIATARVSPKYTDNFGRQCRKLNSDHFNSFEAQGGTITNSVMCREKGWWKQVKTLFKEEY